ncbi:MAG: hypothetical protein IH623_32395 [Verrucomicrobia bacterium]|nr:hypothetical protein [Verrucomicrobiota bacterium]
MPAEETATVAGQKSYIQITSHSPIHSAEVRCFAENVADSDHGKRKQEFDMITFSAFENRTDFIPFNCSGSIWESYADEMQAMEIDFPQFKDESIFIFRVETFPNVFLHFFFLQYRNEIKIVGENLAFPSPRELLDYFKSAKCSKERILAKMEAEEKLSEENSVNEVQ